MRSGVSPGGASCLIFAQWCFTLWRFIFDVAQWWFTRRHLFSFMPIAVSPGGAFFLIFARWCFTRWRFVLLLAQWWFTPRPLILLCPVVFHPVAHSFLSSGVSPGSAFFLICARWCFTRWRFVLELARWWFTRRPLFLTMPSGAPSSGALFLIFETHKNKYVED